MKSNLQPMRRVGPYEISKRQGRLLAGDHRYLVFQNSMEVHASARYATAVRWAKAARRATAKRDAA